jgi:hypothetical protein
MCALAITYHTKKQSNHAVVLVPMGHVACAVKHDKHRVGLCQREHKMVILPGPMGPSHARILLQKFQCTVLGSTSTNAMTSVPAHLRRCLSAGTSTKTLQTQGWCAVKLQCRTAVIASISNAVLLGLMLSKHHPMMFEKTVACCKMCSSFT